MASKSKYTEGPWSVADYKTLGTGDHVVGSAELGDGDPHPVVASVRKRPGHKANAHLIAAAPDLAAALAWLAEHHNAGLPTGYTAVLAKLTRAADKARGV